tara:strand:+ start:3245 stop:3616 length:372 start_codon:yes stop_codon:yes gene_type:complete
MTQALTGNQSKWLAALRSGNYAQGQGALQCGDKFCCLGVAASIFATSGTRINPEPSVVVPDRELVAYDGCAAMAPPYVIGALGLRGSSGEALTGISLASLNDHSLSFHTIADMIEADPERFFE